MEKIVVANMKMNLELDEVNNYLEGIKSWETDGLVFCPPSIYLPYFLGKGYEVGIQNYAMYENGAYTGEISAKQVKSMNINYAIIGHSERREYFNETDDIINKKMKLGVKNNLNIILCIGETLKHKENKQTEEILKTQIINDFKDVDDISNIIIAYEPIWSIGTGLIPTNEEIYNTTKFIKEVINELYNKDIRVLYGGSVNDDNVTILKDIENLSGFLVGGASLKPEKLKRIKETIIC